MTITRILLGATGVGLAAYGLDLLLKMSTPDLPSVAVWFVGVILAEILVFGPVAALAGLLGRLVLPARWWPAYAVGALFEKGRPPERVEGDLAGLLIARAREIAKIKKEHS